MNSLKLAVQKKGRLTDQSLALLKAAGIRLENGTGKLMARATNFPLELLFLRDDDIPSTIARGMAHTGILGRNELLEQNEPVAERLPLGFAKCRLMLAVKREEDCTDLSWFAGKRIATSYPEVTAKFFADNGIEASVEPISGSVEIAPGMGLADAVCDLVSTGSTLLANGLKPVFEVLNSEAVLVTPEDLAPEPAAVLDELLFRIEAVQRARRTKYILLNAPNNAIPAIQQVLPGMRSPTVLPLAEPGWSSLHAAVPEDDFWNIIGQLKDLGAEGILVSALEKVIA